MKLWSVDSGENTLTLVGHTDTVYCVVQLGDGRLCSGSHDSTAKVWDKDTRACNLTINAESGVLSLAILTNGRVCCGLVNGSVKI
jgi:WD40 repeat protein